MKEVFQEALGHPPEAWSDVLDAACGEDGALRAEVAALLDHTEASTDFLEEPVRHLAASIVAAQDASPPPQRIGSYRIVRELGRGGMGTVYHAQRADAQFEQEAAIKVIKRGMDTDEIHRRFLEERRILARLSHPNIARLLDGGVTEDERPYFVMEYIQGTDLGTYVRERRPSLDARLRLFEAVCDAVHVAHTNLVLHRDLKPSNILVLEDGTPKLLDFGVAKALEPHADAPESTVAGARYLTLAYASPEQIRAQPLTTASDVYGLGVLLFELLTGARPHDTRGVSVGEAEQTICSQPAPAASSRAPATGPVTSRDLAGDLDAVIAKALRLEPDDRYESAAALADDVRRFRQQLPVEALQGARWYRTRKFLARHTVGVGLSAVALVALIAGATVFTVQSLRIATEREKAQQVSVLLVDLLSGSDPSEALGDTLTARALLDRSSERIHAELEDQPELQASLLGVVGELYHSLGLLPEAREPLEEALSLRERALPAGHPEIADNLLSLAGVLDAQGDYDRAEPLFRRALTIARGNARGPDAQVARALNGLGQLLLFARQDFEAAEPALLEALDMRRQLFEAPHRRIAETVHNLALLSQLQGDYARAEELYTESLEMRRTLYGPRHPALVTTLNNLALVKHQLGQLQAAEPLYRESLALREALLGSSHLSMGVAHVNFGLFLRDRGALEEAERTLRTGHQILEAGLGPAHPQTASGASNLAEILLLRGQLEEAEERFRSSLAARRAALGPEHPHVAYSVAGLAEVARSRDRLREADSLHADALQLRERVLGPEHPDVGLSLVGFAATRASLGDTATALAYLERAESIRNRALGPAHPLVAEVEVARALLDADEAPSEAQRRARGAVEVLTRHFGDAHWRTAEAQAALAWVLHRSGQDAEAAEWADHARSSVDALLPSGQAALMRLDAVGRP